MGTGSEPISSWFHWAVKTSYTFIKVFARPQQGLSISESKDNHGEAYHLSLRTGWLGEICGMRLDSMVIFHDLVKISSNQSIEHHLNGFWMTRSLLDLSFCWFNLHFVGGQISISLADISILDYRRGWPVLPPLVVADLPEGRRTEWDIGEIGTEFSNKNMGIKHH